MANLNPSLEKKLFHISAGEGEAVMQPHGVLDDALGKTVAIGFYVNRHA